MLGGDTKWSTQSTNNFTGVRNEQHGSLGNLCLTVPFLNAYGGPNHERSSPPLLTVLPLLTAEHQQEGGWVEKTRGRDLWGENPGVFFWSPPLVLALGCSEVFCACLQGTNGRIHATEIGAHIPYRSPTQRDARTVPYETQVER